MRVVVGGGGRGRTRRCSQQRGHAGFAWVAVRFPLATIDQERGDRRIIAEADNLVELAGPSHLVELHLKVVGRVAYVTICDEASGPRFGFILLDTPFGIEIEYERLEDREVCRPLLEALAAALAEYDIHSEDIVDEDLDD